MSQHFNYRHLYYFWVVAKAGGMAKGAAQLGMAIQTVSAQVRALEQSLGHALLKPAGRGLVLTEAGQAALQQAEQIFQLGEQLPAAVREAASSPVVRLAVGVADSLPKLVVWRLMQPALQTPPFRLLCHVDEVNDLLGDLALHRLDVVLGDRPAPANPNLRLYSHALGSSGVAWYGPPALVAQAKRCCCPRRMLRCACRWTNGSSAMASARRWWVSLKTVPCSRPLARTAWACFPPPRGCMTTCCSITVSSSWGCVMAYRSTSLPSVPRRSCCTRWCGGWRPGWGECQAERQADGSSGEPLGQGSVRRLLKARAWPVIGSVKAMWRASSASGCR